MTPIPFNDENKAKIIEVGNYLLGTCGSLADALEKYFGEEDLAAFDIELLRELDDITMECQGCNWWCETGFLNDDQICEDCEPTPDEDET